MVNRPYSTIAIALFLLMSCKEAPMQRVGILPASSKTLDVQLIDTLGTVTLSIPVRYDTSFSWIDHSDCGKPCEMQKYRFQPKSLKMTKESGWIWIGEPTDSVERFTISHSGYFPFHNGDTSKNLVRHNHIKVELASDSANPPIVFDTIEKIADRYYSIIKMERSDNVQSKRIIAVTTIKGNLIRFEYDLLTKKRDSIERGFIKNSIDLIRTIRLSKGI